MADDRIVERIYMKGDLELMSPLIIGSGEDENTDIDVIRDWEGTPFIPGTSLAGAFRHYLTENYMNGKTIADQIFGERSKLSKLSLFLFYDAVLKSKANVLIRDGVHLDYSTKTVVSKDIDQFSKYDFEILEAGQQFQFRMEAMRRNNSNTTANEFKDLIFTFLDSLQNEKISVGAKTRRGFGVLKLTNEQILILDMSKPEIAKQWLTFDWNSFTGNTNVPDLKKGILNSLNNIEEIKVTFNIPYSILIRYYSEEYRNVDSSHISSNGKSIVPGTSWNGAIRHAAHQILLDLGANETKIETLEKDLFGYAAEKDANSHASNLTVKESVINNGIELLTYTRNKVDRFTGGVVDAALFDEMPYYNGNVSLDINLKLKDKEKEAWKIGLIKLAIRDIGTGIQPVGGDANIGRGILELSEEFKIEEKYLQALARKLEE